MRLGGSSEVSDWLFPSPHPPPSTTTHTSYPIHVPTQKAMWIMKSPCMVSSLAGYFLDFFLCVRPLRLGGRPAGFITLYSAEWCVLLYAHRMNMRYIPGPLKPLVQSTMAPRGSLAVCIVQTKLITQHSRTIKILWSGGTLSPQCSDLFKGHLKPSEAYGTTHPLSKGEV